MVRAWPSFPPYAGGLTGDGRGPAGLPGAAARQSSPRQPRKRFPAAPGACHCNLKILYPPTVLMRRPVMAVPAALGTSAMRPAGSLTSRRTGRACVCDGRRQARVHPPARPADSAQYRALPPGPVMPGRSPVIVMATRRRTAASDGRRPAALRGCGHHGHRPALRVFKSRPTGGGSRLTDLMRPNRPGAAPPRAVPRRSGQPVRSCRGFTSRQARSSRPAVTPGLPRPWRGSDLSAAAGALQRSRVGALGALGEPAGLAADQQPHRHDRCDSRAAQDPGPLTALACDAAGTAHRVQRAWVGDRRAARTAGSSPAMAPMMRAAPMPPAHASGGMTIGQPLALA